MLSTVICVAPLPFGSNAPLPIALLGLALALGLACAPLPRRPAQSWMLAALAGLAGLIGVTIAIQLHPETAPDPVWTEAARLLGRPVEGRVALLRDAPLFALGNSALCLGAVALGVLVGADRHRARLLVHAAGWAALVYAMVGIVNAALDPDALLWRERENYFGAVLGPFVNRNTAAIYFGCGAILWLVRLGSRLPPADRPVSVPGWQAWKPAIGDGLAAGVCLAAVVATGSRSGTLLSLCGIAAIGLYSGRTLVRQAPPRLRVAILGAPLLLGAVTLLSGTAGMRLQSLGFADEGRLAVYRAVLLMIRDHPWLGTGLGTFASVYPSYRSSVPGMRNVWDKAHSTPLELAAEVGLPLTVVICVTVLAALAILARGALMRRRDGEIPLAAAGCFGLVLVQSCIDFSLQIPGLAVVVMGLVGAGLAQSFTTGERGPVRSTGPSRSDLSPGPPCAPSDREA